MKKLTIILIACVLVLFTGCAMLQRTVYVYPELPELKVKIPEKPTLIEVKGNIPKEVNENTIKLITYSKELELVIDNYGAYLDTIRTNWSEKNAKN